MTNRFFITQSIYLVILFVYYLFILLLNNKYNEGEFDVIVFDYWRTAIILFLCFFLTNFIVFFNKHNNFSQRKSYPFIFHWSTFAFFLVISIIFFFYNFISIGAPFKQNIFLNLLIPHTISFFLIRFSLASIGDNR